MISIAELWYSSDHNQWLSALERYWDFVKPDRVEIEKALDVPDLSRRIRSLNATEWYDFLRDEYFWWKYTTDNRYATTTKQLEKYVYMHELDQLDIIRQNLLSMENADVKDGLSLACRIRGLGTAGASGLLALMYPQKYGTVDQFVLKALQNVPTLPDHNALMNMKPVSLTIDDGVILVRIMQDKARDNNQQFVVSTWTPRKIDKILWTYGR